MEVDVAALVELLNEWVPEGREAITVKKPLPIPKKGPLLHKDADWPEELDKNDIQGRHFRKYSDCGPLCMDLARIYFRRDFEVLQYPEA